MAAMGALLKRSAMGTVLEDYSEGERHGNISRMITPVRGSIDGAKTAYWALSGERTFPSYGVLDHGKQVWHLEWLEQIIVHAPLYRFDCQLSRAVRRHKNNRNPPIRGMNLF
jgi:hypothetical protein